MKQQKKADAMVRARDIKKSDFLEVTATESADRFDLVRNGQNFKIARDNLIADFGVSGPLQTLGEATATPILSISGATNYIRNLLSGAGILTSISPQNGVQIDHRFNIDKTGVPIMINEGADSPTFRSIQAGSGINVAGAGDVVQVSVSATPVSTKTVNVYSIDDFPAPVGGIITLEDDTEYRLQNDVSSVNRYVFGANTVLSGADATLISLEYTGTGTMITVTDEDCKIKDLKLICSSGTVFDVSSTSGLNYFRLYNSIIICDEVGSFDNIGVMYIFSANFFVTTDGFYFYNNFSVVLLDTVGFTMPSGTGNAYTLGTAVFEYLTFSKCIFDVNTTGYIISGAASSANIGSTGLGVILDNKNFGTATFSDNISQYDDRWEAQLNSTLINSFDLMLATHAASTITISAAATPVIIGATWVEEDAHRISSTVGGRFTYNGKGSHVEVTASISGDIVTASDNVSFYLYKNSVQITNSRVTRLFTAGSIGNVVLLWDLELATSDYLELWVSNDDTNVDVNISKITFRIRS